MKLVEPQRWVDLLQSLNTCVSSSQTFFSITSFVADAVVFLFPILLFVLYVIWIRKNNNVRKEYALRIFSSTVIAAIINTIIQFFFEKARPETVLEGTQRLILKHLPTMSFPSDHAAVWMSFGIAMVLFAYMLSSTRAKPMRLLWWLFVLAAIAMSVARVGVWIHRPTDIIAGWWVWLIAVWVTKYIPQTVYWWIIWVEKKIFSVLYR